MSLADRTNDGTGLLTPEELNSSIERLHSMRDQTILKVMGWLSIGNAAALAFSVTQIVGKSAPESCIWSLALTSSWFFLGGLINAVFAMFFFSKAMNEFAQHAQLSLIAIRNENKASLIDKIAQASLSSGQQATKIVGWTATISAACFIIGAGVALWKVGATAPIA